MSHANARLNVRGRVLLVQRVLVEHRPVAHVAKELGVSRQCAHRWVNRFREHGIAGLADRSSRPLSMPRRTTAEVEQRVLTLRRQLRQGPDRLAIVAGVPARTISAILRRHRVPHLAQCDPLTGAVIRASKTTAIRYERARPGELVHMDVKKLGRIPDGGGWRAGGKGDPTTTATAARESDSTTSTLSSTTTPGWRTPRSCRTRKDRRARRSSPARRPTSSTTASPASNGS